MDAVKRLWEMRTRCERFLKTRVAPVALVAGIIVIFSATVILSTIPRLMAKGDWDYMNTSKSSDAWHELREMPWRLGLSVDNAEEELQYRELIARLYAFQELSSAEQVKTLNDARSYARKETTDGRKASVLLNHIAWTLLYWGENDSKTLKTAVSLFTEAVVRDPENENAKWNLELLRSLMVRQGQDSGGGSSDSNPGPPGRRPPVAGY